MIETQGSIGAIEAADAMVNVGQVSPGECQIVGGGLVQVSCRGELGAVRAAVAAGAEAAR